VVAPAETADCPRWLRLLDETVSDPALVRFLRQFLGMALTGDTSEQAMLFCFGSGTGMSLLMRTLAGLMGDYAASLAPEALCVSERQTGDLARLDGVRLATSADIAVDAAWDATRLKRLTGGDPLTVRALRRNPITFTPAFKLVVLGDRRPALRQLDEALRRRLYVVPVEHGPATPDRRLGEALKAEWPGILRWLIEGCLDWQANGLVRPAAVTAATGDYFDDEDVFGQFLDEACDCAPGDATRLVPAGALYAAWSAFAKEAGAEAGSQRRFAEALQARGFARGRNHSGRHFTGLALRGSTSASAETMPPGVTA
jgi:putative DNA primase/helicase